MDSGNMYIPRKIDGIGSNGHLNGSFRDSGIIVIEQDITGSIQKILICLVRTVIAVISGPFRTAGG